MFVAAKLFWLLAQPLSLAFLLTVLGLVAGAFDLRRSRTALILAAVIIEFVAMFTTVGAWATEVLEHRFARPAKLETIPDCAIVLGGGFDGGVTKVRGGVELTSAGDRFVEGLRLAHLYPNLKLVITGGDPTLDHSTEGDADVAARFYGNYGIEADRLIFEPKSRNTIENAEFTAPLLKANGLNNCLLVTSAFHMPRSFGLFRKANIQFIPWPVDFRTTGQERLGFDIFELSNNALLLEIALHEYTGLVAQYFAGKSDTLFPG